MSKPAAVEPHVRAHDPREEDVADLVVDGVGPLDPVLLHEDAAEAEPRGDGRDLAGVVRLHAADRDERVAALRECVGGEVLELAHLVAAVGQARVAVLALGPDLDRAAEVLAQPLQPVDRRRAEEERHAREAVQTMAAQSRVAYLTFSKGQSESTHPLTALHSGASSSASLARTHESTCASTPSVGTG